MPERQIDFTKDFVKQFKLLRPSQKENFYYRLEILKQNPHERILRNHALKGKYMGYRSIDIAGDLRALYKTQADTIVIFAFIGTHSQLY